MLRGVLAWLVIRPKVDGVGGGQRGIAHHHVIHHVGERKFSSAPMPSRKTAIVLWTPRSTFQRGSLRNAIASQFPSYPRMHLRNSREHRGRVGEHIDTRRVVGADAAVARRRCSAPNCRRCTGRCPARWSINAVVADDAVLTSPNAWRLMLEPAFAVRSDESGCRSAR